jgi:hypothetical protein
MADTDDEKQSKEARAEGVKRALRNEPQPKEPVTHDPEEPVEVGGASSVGESITRRGEDVVKQEGKEPGRRDTGKEGKAERPTGESSARDTTGINPQEGPD